MTVSVIGLLAYVALLAMGWLAGAPLLVGLVASLALGSTAVATLNAVGGASPLVSVTCEVSVCLAAATRASIGDDLARLFARHWEAWVALALAVYAPATAYLLPRLFAGSVNAFVASHDAGIVEVALVPNNGNLTQTGYFVLGTLTFLSVSALLLRPGTLAPLRRAFITWAALIAAGGTADLVGKAAGLGDVLAPIRTAAFAFLTDHEQAGFSRIAGTFSEASSFAASALAGLAFTFTDWRCTGSRLTGALAASLLLLLVLSTSSTAYGGLLCLSAILVVSIGRRACSGRFAASDLLVVVVLAAAAAVALGVMVYDPRLAEPYQNLIQATLVDKLDSQSGRERAYWNQHSLMTVPETWGLGIGFGSSRASNWLIAVISQFGVAGTVLQLALLVPIVMPLRISRWVPNHGLEVGLHTSLCACGAALILGGVVAGGSADPGALFFITLAGILACRRAVEGRSGGRAAPLWPQLGDTGETMLRADQDRHVEDPKPTGSRLFRQT